MNKVICIIYRFLSFVFLTVGGRPNILGETGGVVVFFFFYELHVKIKF